MVAGGNDRTWQGCRDRDTEQRTQSWRAAGENAERHDKGAAAQNDIEHLTSLEQGDSEVSRA